MASDTDFSAADRITDAFNALSHEDRLRIMSRLLERALRTSDGEEPSALIQDDPRWVTFGVIADELELGQSTLSYHLQILADSELIDRSRQGRCTYLRARPERIERMARFLAVQAGESPSDEGSVEHDAVPESDSSDFLSELSSTGSAV